MAQCSRPGIRWLLFLSSLVLLPLLSGCGVESEPAAILRLASPGVPIPSPRPTVQTIANTRPGMRTLVTPGPTAVSDGLPSLPEAFRYEVTLRQFGSPAGAETVITGQYRGGAWQQSLHTGAPAAGNTAQEMIVVDGDTYSRPAGNQDWTRWPGVGFDSAYGLTTPFTVLRLYAFTPRAAQSDLAPTTEAAEPVYRIQAVIPGTKVELLLLAGAAVLTPDAETRTALTKQIAPLATSQSITYWVGKSGRIYRAAATIVAVDSSGQPVPWMEAAWRFWDYENAEIAVLPPAAFYDMANPATAEQLAKPGTSQPSPPDRDFAPDRNFAAPSRQPAGDADLLVRVFASPDMPADDLAVTVYPAGDNRQPIDMRSDPEAAFALPPGRYDVLVQVDYAQEWLRGIEVVAGKPTQRAVTFDFGALVLTATLAGKIVPVDIVAYPSGDRAAWVDWRSENPVTLRLRAGIYDLEIAYADNTKTQRVTGLAVRAGATISRTVTLNP